MQKDFCSLKEEAKFLRGTDSYNAIVWKGGDFWSNGIESPKMNIMDVGTRFQTRQFITPTDLAKFMSVTSYNPSKKGKSWTIQTEKVRANKYGLGFMKFANDSNIVGISDKYYDILSVRFWKESNLVSYYAYILLEPPLGQRSFILWVTETWKNNSYVKGTATINL